MDVYHFDWLGQRFSALASGALWWPAARLLCVSDLHLGRAECLARRGGLLLPPYETSETLDRLTAAIGWAEPETVICLGDSFDDGECEAALAEAERSRLVALMAGRDWIWIAGNHDPGPVTLGGRHLAEHRAEPLVFRHEALAETGPGEVSGHYHPKLRRVLGGRAVARSCFLWDGHRLIMPAFGAFTGGLDAAHPALARLLGPGALAILTGSPCCALPVAEPKRGRARAGRFGI